MAKSNFWGTVGIIAASVLLTLGILRGCAPEEENKNPSDDSVSTEVFTQGIQMRLLKTTENDDGSITKQFTYTITPAEATYQDVSVSASYIDSTDCSAVLTTSVDNSAKTIDVKCLAAFNKQINVVVQSVDNPEAKATVKVDYVKKVLKVQSNNRFSATSSASKYNPIGNGFAASYSIYTIDKDYTFAVKNFVYSSNSMPSTLSVMFRESVANAIKTYINGGITFATEAQLWQMATTNADKAWLLNPQTIALGVQSATIYCVENESVSCTKSSDNLYFTLNYEFTGYKVAVESVSAELGNIQF